jgi:hypothetical protein
MANALAIARHLPDTGLRGQDDVDALVARLRDVDALLPDIRRAMAFVANGRRAYIQSNPASFGSRRDAVDYMEAWVANYEISDFMLAEGCRGTFFVFFNQWPERGTATHEERARLVEEARFGGRVGDKAHAVHDYAAGDAMFIVEEFGVDQPLLCPREWLGATAASGRGRPTRAAMILDLNGHFAACTPVASLGGRPALLVVNTTGASYLSGVGGVVAAAVCSKRRPCTCRAPKSARATRRVGAEVQRPWEGQGGSNKVVFVWRAEKP